MQGADTEGGGEEELYAGLDEVSASPAVAEAGASAAAVRAELAASQREIRALRAQNAVLARNISVLYQTAKAELARKDREIERLSSRGE